MHRAPICILGCGWLGQPLALQLHQSGHSIVATCRSELKAFTLAKSGFTAVTYNLGDKLTSADLSPIFNAEILILNMPVGRKNPDTKDFINNIQSLLAHAANTKISNVIFISTTSVYGEPQGIVTEKTTPAPQTESAMVNLAIEGLVKKYFANSTIIRLAGLVGQDRHPVKYLAGKRNLADADKRVNLVHQQDVIQAIQCVINKKLWSHTLHLCSSTHPSREAYYTFAAKLLSLTPPTFNDSENKETGKQIDASASLALLGMSLAFKSPFEMIGDKT